MSATGATTTYTVPLVPAGIKRTLRTSAEIGQIATAMAKAQASMKHPAKNTENSHFKNKYADLAAVIDAGAAVNDCGIAIFPSTGLTEIGLTHTLLLVHGESGEWVESDLTIPLSKADAQGVGSALTYARRYHLSMVCNLASETDDDGNAAARQSRRNEPDRLPPMVDDPEPRMISQENIDAVRKNAAELGASLEDISAWVKAATEGRTELLPELLTTEIPALRAARDAWRAEKPEPTLPLDAA